LAAALAQAQSEVKQNNAKSGAMGASTGLLNASPRYNREGKTIGWMGTAELVVQGRANASGPVSVHVGVRAHPVAIGLRDETREHWGQGASEQRAGRLNNRE